MGFSRSLDWCGNSSCMRCDLNLYIHPSNHRGRGLFICWLEWFSADWVVCEVVVSPPHCSWVNCFMGILLAKCCLQMVATARPGPKIFQQPHHPYSLGVVQSIVHHCISCRCSSHMVDDAGIGWCRILMTMAHTSLVYAERFRNPRRWEKVNAQLHYDAGFFRKKT